MSEAQILYTVAVVLAATLAVVIAHIVKYARMSDREGVRRLTWVAIIDVILMLSMVQQAIAAGSSS